MAKYVIPPQELAVIFERHVDQLLLIVRSFGGPARASIAEDAVQEAFISLATQSQLPREPLSWLVRVARNQMLQQYRSNARRRRREDACAETNDINANWFGSASESGERLADHLDGAVVTAALRGMESPHREIIVMHLWGEMSFEQIAEVVGGSRATAHRNFVRGMKQLKEQFDPVSRSNATTKIGNRV